MTDKRRVGISLLYVSPERVGGIGIYASSIVRELVRRARHEYVLFIPRAQEAYWREILNVGQAKVVYGGPDPDRLVSRVLYEQLVLPLRARHHALDVMFFPHTFAPIWTVPRSVITVHDLRIISGEELGFSRIKRSYLTSTYRNIGRRAARVATVSEYCRQDINDRLGIPLERISVVTNAVDDVFLTHSAGSLQAKPMGLPAEYLLSVGSVFPHKRHGTTLEAFESLADEFPSLHLVFAGVHVGPPGALADLRDRAARSRVSTRIHFLPHLSRSSFPALYAQASALVTASAFEGFGLPVVEAMAMGCPVAASPASAVVEVLNGTGWVAADFSTTALVDVLRAALRARDEGVERLRKAQERARSVYSWSSAAMALEELCSAAAAE